MAALRILALRLGLSQEEYLELQVGIAWTYPGVPSTRCPF